MKELMVELNNCDVHFVRCIKVIMNANRFFSQENRLTTNMIKNLSKLKFNIWDY